MNDERTPMSNALLDAWVGKNSKEEHKLKKKYPERADVEAWIAKQSKSSIDGAVRMRIRSNPQEFFDLRSDCDATSYGGPKDVRECSCFVYGLSRRVTSEGFASK